MRKLLLLMLILSNAISYAQNQSCSEAQGRKALDEADQLRTWDDLYRSYQKFAPCDDGAIGEGYSESVVRILADHWNTLPQLAALSHSNKHFAEFVLRHVDATVTDDDLHKIRTNAIRFCPVERGDLCKQLRIAADKALEGTGDATKN